MNINIEVPDEVHRKIKILSAMQGIPIKDLVVKSLEEYVKKHEK